MTHRRDCPNEMSHTTPERHKKMHVFELEKILEREKTIRDCGGRLGGGGEKVGIIAGTGCSSVFFGYFLHSMCLFLHVRFKNSCKKGKNATKKYNIFCTFFELSL